MIQKHSRSSRYRLASPCGQVAPSGSGSSYPQRMRLALAATALGITLLSAAGLAACSSDGPVRPRTPAPSATPVFASEEEALAAAEALYGEYSFLTNAIGQEGWVNVDALTAYVRGRALVNELESAAAFRGKGWRQVGDSTHDSIQLQRWVDQGRGGVEIVFYVCLDVSAVDVVDSDGSSVVSESRPSRQPLEVTVDDSEDQLKISEVEPWTGADFC